MYCQWKILVLPEDLEELQECREVDNGVAESTGGTTGRGIKGDGSQRDDTDGYMERLELPEDRWSTVVTRGSPGGEVPE